MKQDDDNEKLLIRYLLGELSEAEQARLEERLFADDEYFEQLAAVEYDLIDEYVRGELAPHEQARFENHFLVVPGRRHRVALARSVLQTVSELAAEKRSKPVVARRDSVLRRRFWPASPARQLALAAMALIAVAIGTWLLAERLRLQTQLAQLQTERQTWQQQERVLQQDMAQQRKRQEELAKQLQREQSQRARLEQELAAQPPSRPTVPVFVLSSLARDPGEAKTLAIPSGTPSVQLRIDLEQGDDYQRYQAVLQTVEGREIWSRDGLPARRTHWGQAVILKLPAPVLTPGDYELQLRGVAASGKFEDIGYYYFGVVKK
jgi:hypothetical protein